MEASDFGFYLLLCLVLHPIIKLYKKYDCIKFRRNVVSFTEEVLNSYNFTSQKLYTIKEQIEYWLDTHNLDYYNRRGQHCVEDCSKTILKEILVNEVDGDGDLILLRIENTISHVMYCRMLGKGRNHKTSRTTWYKIIWKSINEASLEEAVVALHYIFLIIAWAIAVNVYYTKSFAHAIHKEYTKRADNFYENVSYIRHSTMLMDTIFTNILDSTSNYYMNEYFIECAKDLNEIIIDKTNSYDDYIEFMKEIKKKNN